MPDIFLSYSREDQATARRFAEGFEREGFSVWWDQTLHSGEAYDQVTERALEEARAVVVLWSKKSVESRWVRAEATQAGDARKLVPVMIESCKRPIMFELTHTADLVQWKGDTNDPVWRSYVADVHRFVGRTGAVAPATPAAPAARRPGGVMIVAAIVVALIAAALLWVLAHGTGKQAVTAAAAGTKGAASVSLAVLPFVDMSPQHDQDYFSDGLSEELLNQLAQVKGLRLTARTSSFSFKGKNEDMRVIGEKLGVGNILEGSVRKSGDQLRITAQLINATDGTHRWSEIYDRKLTDVFAVQEEIAKAVSQALSVTLDVGAMSRANGGTTNVEAYDKYLRAQAFDRQFGTAEYLQAAQLLREAVALDPSFARAWVELYGAIGAAYRNKFDAVADKEMNEAAAKAIALAPRSWWVQSFRVDRLVQDRKWSEAEAMVDALIASAPSTESPCGIQAFLGRIQDVVPCFERARQADPLAIRVSHTLQVLLDSAGRSADAQVEYERSKKLAGADATRDQFALLRLWKRKDATPAAIKARIGPVLQQGLPPPALSPVLAERPNDKIAALAALHRAFEDPISLDAAHMYVISLYADHYGDRALALAALRRAVIDFKNLPIYYLWYPFESDLRTDPRFKDILRDVGLVDYFRASGKWGDFCKPVGQNDFECH